MTWDIALKLGRVSNLPTVWTNAMAGIVLAGQSVADPRAIPLLIALSLFYIGGMYLNDAFDAEIDAKERPERPIPSGRVSRRTVYLAGSGMLAAALLALVWIGFGTTGGTGIWPIIGGLALGAAIIAYDWHHKANPFSPVIMGLCRVLVYVTAGLSLVVPLPAILLIGAGLLLCYLIGLTYVAKQENLGRVENLWPLAFLAAPVIYGASLAANQPVTALFWVFFTGWMAVSVWFVKRRRPGDIPRAVVSLIAGICLFDAMLIAGAGEIGIAVLAGLGFLLTLALQRFVPGT